MIDNPLNRVQVKRGSELPQSKLTEYDVKLILQSVSERERLRKQANEMSNKALSDVFGVHERTIEKAVAGYTWGHVYEGS